MTMYVQQTVLDKYTQVSWHFISCIMFHRHLWQSRDLINICSTVSVAHDTYHRVKKAYILYFVVICICDITQERSTWVSKQGLRMCRGSTVDEHCDNEGHSLPHYSSAVLHMQVCGLRYNNYLLSYHWLHLQTADSDSFK